uniref:Uncharacterized protein n=1 Tax=Angiostrongylus cantonensis TaxID=6313 RepID=A0A0K0D3C7_ANGCA
MPFSSSIYGSNSNECNPDYCRVKIPPVVLTNSLFDPGLDIELRWDDWTSCNGNVPAQRREAHCYVVARQSFTLDEDAEHIASHIYEFNWIVKLGRLVRSEALRKTGVRLHSSIIASYLYRKEVLQGCGGIEEGIRIAADDAWRKHFLFPIGIRHPEGKYIEKYDDVNLSLDNTFQACFR